MGISQYLKEIGRGKDGARPISRAQAADLFGQLLDGAVSDLEVGAFCLAMRMKGETPEEMAGFLDATHARLHRVPASQRPLVVLPSYNGARRLPVLTPLLALLLARRGLPVLVHGAATESSRVFASDVFEVLGLRPSNAIEKIADGSVAWVSTGLLHDGLLRLLQARRVIGLRNPAHSLVKLMNPSAGRALVVSSYTHPEYARSMAAAFELTGANALLLRGTEGEAVADARRHPRMQGFIGGRPVLLDEGEKGTLASVPALPASTAAAATADYVRAVLESQAPLPSSIARQLEHILLLVSQL